MVVKACSIAFKVQHFKKCRNLGQKYKTVCMQLMDWSCMSKWHLFLSKKEVRNRVLSGQINGRAWSVAVGGSSGLPMPIPAFEKVFGRSCCLVYWGQMYPGGSCSLPSSVVVLGIYGWQSGPDTPARTGKKEHGDRCGASDVVNPDLELLRSAFCSQNLLFCQKPVFRAFRNWRMRAHARAHPRPRARQQVIPFICGVAVTRLPETCLSR